MEASDRNIVGLLRTWASTHPIDTRMFTPRPFPTTPCLFDEVNFTSIRESMSGPWRDVVRLPLSYRLPLLRTLVWWQLLLQQSFGSCE